MPLFNLFFHEQHRPNERALFWTVETPHETVESLVAAFASNGTLDLTVIASQKVAPRVRMITARMAQPINGSHIRDIAPVDIAFTENGATLPSQHDTLPLIDRMTRAARQMLDLHDEFMAGRAVDKAAADRLYVAAIFGAAAKDRCPMADAEVPAMLRAFLLALIDPKDPQLDYLRAGPVTVGKERAHG